MIKVYYSHTPFWRAEVLRVSLYISNIPFEDVRISRDEFINMIKTGFLPNGKRVPFHQLPVIEVDGEIIGQTGAIARYCGKISNLYSNDNINAAKIDQIIDAAQDINYLVTLSGRNKEPERKKIDRDILANKHLPKWFQFLENLLQQNTNSVYFVSNELTIADLAIWRLLGWLKSGLLDGVPANILDNFENLNKLREEVYKNPKVIKWMDQVYGKVI